jgi:uncharacterized membrane protein
MNFKKIFLIWLVITVVFGIFTFLVNHFFPTHTLWPFGVAFLYIGVLMLYMMYLISTKKE